MGATLEFDARRAGAAIGKLGASLGQAWSEKLSRPLGLAAAPVELLDDAALRALLPPTASAFGCDQDGQLALLLIIPRAGLAGLLAAQTGADEEAIRARMTADDDLSAEENTALEDFAQVGTQTLIAGLGGTLEARVVDHLKDATWASGNDPLPGAEMVVTKLSLTLEGFDAVEALLLMKSEVAAQLKAPTAGGAGSGASADGLLFLSSRSEFGAKVLAMAGCELGSVDSLADLVRDFGGPESRGALVAVAAGDEHLLGTVASLRDHPGCEDKQVVIVLENPTVWNVVRCGRLGLFSVLGPEFQESDLRRRLETQSS